MCLLLLSLLVLPAAWALYVLHLLCKHHREVTIPVVARIKVKVRK